MLFTQIEVGQTANSEMEKIYGIKICRNCRKIENLSPRFSEWRRIAT